MEGIRSMTQAPNENTRDSQLQKKLHQEEKHSTWYKCDICEKSLYGILPFRSHMRQVHTRIGWHFCNHCGLSCPTKSKLERHIKYFHDEPAYQCDICKKKFRQEKMYHKHIATDIHDENGDWHCEICDFITNSRSKLNVHRKYVHENRRMFKCEKCPAAYPDTSKLEMHVQNIHEGVRFKCDLCDESFTLKKNVGRHKKRKHTKKRILFKCEHCCNEFVSNYVLKQHSKTCQSKLQRKEKLENDKLIWHTCDICEKTFYGITALRIHRRRLHERKGDLLCDLCDDTFDRPSRLEDHKKSKHLKQQFECDICMKTFNARRLLQFHIERLHTTKQSNRYFCDICDKEFQMKPDFLKHYRGFHKNVQEFLCEYCDKKLSTKLTLEKHIGRFHTDKVTSKFQCEKCQKTFTLESNLKKHIQSVHLNERDFCNICGKSISKDNLRQHLLNVHPSDNNKFQCKCCNKSFASKTYLNFHIKNMHSKKSNKQAMHFEYSDCKKGFSHRNDLEQHNSRVHPDLVSANNEVGKIKPIGTFYQNMNQESSLSIDINDGSDENSTEKIGETDQVLNTEIDQSKTNVKAAKKDSVTKC